MNRFMFAGAWLIAVVFGLTASRGLAGDVAASKTSAEPAANQTAEQPSAKLPSLNSPYRPLAPGVMHTIDPMRSLDETEGRHDVVELTAVDSKFDWAKDIAFRRDVWALEFQFKPVRMIWVDIPQPDGLMQRNLIWYMVYCVTNPGKIMHPVEDVEVVLPDRARTRCSTK